MEWDGIVIDLLPENNISDHYTFPGKKLGVYVKSAPRNESIHDCKIPVISMILDRRSSAVNGLCINPALFSFIT